MNDYEIVKEVLLERGWIKKTLHDPETDRVCIIGAMTFSAIENINDCFYGIESEILEYFPDRRDQNRNLIASFNDHPETTFNDVLLILDKAAANAT